MKKYTKEELFKMDAVDVYKMILDKQIKAFPNGFWIQSESKQNAGKCIKYLIEEKLELDDEKLKKQLSHKFFEKYKLSSMLRKCFNSSIHEAINYVYPSKFKPWEFKQVPNGYWTKENGIKATKWLIEEKIKLNDEELKEKLSEKLFEENGLLGMLTICFDKSPYKAINATYPNKFKEWEFKNVSKGYWDNEENRIKAIKWLIEEKLKLSHEEVQQQLSYKLFKENMFWSMIKFYYNGNAYKAINAAYPNQYKINRKSKL